MTKKQDALARAVGEVRSASLPRARLAAARRADDKRGEDRERGAAQRSLDALRSRLAEVAPAADAWFVRWVRKGRLDLVLRARADVKESRIVLPRFRITRNGAVWTTEDKRADEGQHRWYDFALGKTHSIFGGLTGIKFFGGIGGDLGTVRSLAELSRRKMKCPEGRRWDGMEHDVLHVGLRVAELLRDDVLEPMLVDRLRREAGWVGKVARRESAELALIRREPGAERRFRKVVEEQGISNAVVTPDALVHLVRRTGRAFGPTET